MVIAFANNQVIAANTSTMSTIYTDPVPLNGNDRATCHLFVEYIFNTAAPGIAYQAEVSNDGVNWANAPGVTDSSTTVTNTPKPLPGTVNGAFLRFKITFTASGAGIGICNFDLHVLLDHV